MASTAIATEFEVPGGRHGGALTDAALVARVRAGDDLAFEWLYRRYERRIAAYVQRRVKDHGRTEDVVQEVFVSALRRMRETRTEIVFRPWIYEIARNASIDHFRRARRTEEVSYDADGALGPVDDRRLASLGGPSPEAAVDTKLRLHDLQGAFGGLTDTQRDLLVMREFEGLSYQEIGERLGMSRPSVESTLFRARRKLAEEFEEIVSGERCRRVEGIIEAASGGPVGVRDRGRLARHVSHCQPCRRHAIRAGIDSELLSRRPLRARVAALLPFPAFLRRRGGGGSESATSAAPAHLAQAAQWSAPLAGAVDPAIASCARAAAIVVASVAVAGAGAHAVDTLRTAPPRSSQAATATATTPASRGSAGGAARVFAAVSLARTGDSSAAFPTAPSVGVPARRSLAGTVAAVKLPMAPAPTVHAPGALPLPPMLDHRKAPPAHDRVPPPPTPPAQRVHALTAGARESARSVFARVRAVRGTARSLGRGLGESGGPAVAGAAARTEKAVADAVRALGTGG